MNLTIFEQNGLELVINTETGEVFASQSALARMVGASRQAINKWITVNEIEQKNAEIFTTTGLKTVNLVSEDAIYRAFSKYKPELLVQCAKAGLRIYLHRLAGFEVTSSAVQPQYQVPKSYAEALLEAGRLALENDLLSTKITADKPKVEFASAISASDDAIDFNAFAKMIGELSNSVVSTNERCGRNYEELNSSLPEMGRWWLFPSQSRNNPTRKFSSLRIDNRQRSVMA